MLDLKFVLSHLDEVKTCLKDRGSNEGILKDLEKIIPLAGKRNEILTKGQKLKALRNKVSEDIAALKKKKEDASELIARMKETSRDIKKMDEKLREIENTMNESLLGIPNMLHESTPVGPDESYNEQIRTWGTKPSFDFPVRDHIDIGEITGTLDFETAGTISGARFAIYKNHLARLERALINFMLDIHVENGYEEVLPPYLVNSASMRGTGQLPKFSFDSFKVEDADLWLVPTAEVPVTNFFRDRILSNEQLPESFVAYTTCFRKEAGSYGKDVRGLIRQHQFNKVELVRFTKPERSMEDLESLLKDAE